MARIVLVEDEAQLRDLIALELDDEGHEVLRAADGREGLETIVRERPDIVICDWLMPRMSGHDLFVALRRDHAELEALPFVFMSAHADREHVQRGLGLGADAYLTKPVDFDQLFETIDRILQTETGS